MADDLQSNLESYNLQLQQVEAALTSDPSNEELLKLKTDLTEVIELTKELFDQQSGPGSSYGDESRSWKVGDRCLAPWSQDGKYYEAVIEEIHDDGRVSVGFQKYSHGDVTQVSQLKVFDASYIEPSRDGQASTSGTSRIAPKESLAERKQALQKQKEYLKKRKQKKVARVHELEAEREKSKKSWLNFSTKKGLLNKKKSIFASPESVQGRVGVGTCGVSGKPMTEYSAADKWRKGWTK
ncbi:survival of motor neuron-related-splicing factor 30 [Folsomia candida]|uniref:Survival of motor neuron-related-splicing factor 30 n=1 Tax=Folsomia candida TaxID=158441 RepID=A0A226EN00_FOLCA|nr:survival of motor neuron-related-splicing factor 30 [Folsomia candida]OXA58171.1 Survival of motor neuron-related-splicing factor 30 [Folsomia candida]